MSGCPPLRRFPTWNRERGKCHIYIQLVGVSPRAGKDIVEKLITVGKEGQWDVRHEMQTMQALDLNICDLA